MKFRVTEIRGSRTEYEIEAESERDAQVKFPDDAEVTDEGDEWTESLTFEEIEGDDDE